MKKVLVVIAVTPFLIGQNGCTTAELDPIEETSIEGENPMCSPLATRFAAAASSIEMSADRLRFACNGQDFTMVLEGEDGTLASFTQRVQGDGSASMLWAMELPDASRLEREFIFDGDALPSDLAVASLQSSLVDALSNVFLDQPK